MLLWSGGRRVRSWDAFWRGCEVQRQPSTQSTITGRNKKLKVFTDFHLFVSPFCFIIPSSIPLFFSPVPASLTLCHTTQTLFLQVFGLFSTFIFIALVALHVFHFCRTLSCSLLLSVPPLSTPLLSISYSFTLSLSFFCYSSISDHWHRNGTTGSADPGVDIVLQCMLRQQYFPSAPECLFFLPFSPPLCVCPRLLLCSQYRCHHVQQPCLSTRLHRPSRRGLFRAPINHFSLTD